MSQTGKRAVLMSLAIFGVLGVNTRRAGGEPSIHYARAYTHQPAFIDYGTPYAPRTTTIAYERAPVVTTTVTRSCAPGWVGVTDYVPYRRVHRYEPVRVAYGPPAIVYPHGYRHGYHRASLLHHRPMYGHRHGYHGHRGYGRGHRNWGFGVHGGRYGGGFSFHYSR